MIPWVRMRWFTLVENDPSPRARHTMVKPTGVAHLRNFGKYFKTANHMVLVMYMIPFYLLAVCFGREERAQTIAQVPTTAMLLDPTKSFAA
jgi:hypothetical protein